MSGKHDIEIQSYMLGSLILKFKLPDEMIQEINDRYDAASDNLQTYGHNLAGQIDNEKLVRELLDDDMNRVFQVCFEQYLNALNKPLWDVNLEAAWINEMKAGEYNPLHGHGSHKADLGLSSVLMLKRPDTYGVEVKPDSPTNGRLELVGGNQDALGLSNWQMDIQPGDFVVFPFTMLHTVYPFNGTTQARRTLSYNCDLTLKTMKPKSSIFSK